MELQSGIDRCGDLCRRGAIVKALNFQHFHQLKDHPTIKKYMFFS